MSVHWRAQWGKCHANGQGAAESSVSCRIRTHVARPTTTPQNHQITIHSDLPKNTVYMIKKKFSTPFHSFPNIPILSLPCGPRDVPIVSVQNTVVGISDCTAWLTGAHISSSNYSIMHLVSLCKQDATVELLVLLTHFLFSR